MRLAHEYATSQPSVIRVGVGAERYPGGGQAMRAVDCLPALVGAWRHVGRWFIAIAGLCAGTFRCVGRDPNGLVPRRA